MSGGGQRERIQDHFALSQGEINQKEGLGRDGVGSFAVNFGSKSFSLSQIQINSTCNLNCRGIGGIRDPAVVFVIHPYPGPAIRVFLLQTKPG